jgi:hypothetical protein
MKTQNDSGIDTRVHPQPSESRRKASHLQNASLRHKQQATLKHVVKVVSQLPPGHPSGLKFLKSPSPDSILDVVMTSHDDVYVLALTLHPFICGHPTGLVIIRKAEKNGRLKSVNITGVKFYELRDHYSGQFYSKLADAVKITNQECEAESKRSHYKDIYLFCLLDCLNQTGIKAAFNSMPNLVEKGGADE